MKFIFKNLPSEVGGIRENSECIQLKRYKRQSDFLICKTWTLAAHRKGCTLLSHLKLSH